MIWRSKIKRKCKVCGKEFYPSRKEIYTCSKKCGCQLRKGKTAIAKKKILICDNCGKRFKRRASCTRYAHVFCDRKCYAEHKQRNMTESKNSNWRGGVSKKNLARTGKGNRAYRKGKYYENLIRKEFEEKGFYVTRSAASKGIWDLIAINESLVVLIQSKANALPRPKEREIMANFKCPPNTIKQFWRFFGYGKKEVWTHSKDGWIKENFD